MARVLDTQAEGRVNVKNEAGREDESIRWRVTFIDVVTAQRMDVEVCAQDIQIAHERAWAALRARQPTGLVVVDLVETRRADETIDRGLPREGDDEGDQSVHPPRRGQ